jgi:hypothetical protein
VGGQTRWEGQEGEADPALGVLGVKTERGGLTSAVGGAYEGLNRCMKPYVRYYHMYEHLTAVTGLMQQHPPQHLVKAG